MEKIEQIKSLLKSGKTFTGLDFQLIDNNVELKNDYSLSNAGDVFAQFLSKYSARGVYLENATPQETKLLSEVFGQCCIVQPSNSFNNVTILTHIDKKGLLERTVEGAFGITGGVLSIPAGLAMPLGEQIGNKGVAAIPLLVLSAGITIPAVVGSGIGLLAGTTLASTPKIYDKIKDWTNGDEREFACNIAEKIIHNQTTIKELDITKKLEVLRSDNNNSSKNKNRI